MSPQRFLFGALILFCICGLAHSQRGLASFFARWASQVTSRSITYFGNGVDLLEKVPKTIQVGKVKIKPNMVRARSTKGSKQLADETDLKQIQAEFPAGRVSNIPEPSSLLHGEGIAAVRVELSDTTLVKTMAKQADIAEASSASSVARQSNEIATDVVDSASFDALASRFGAVRRPTRLPPIVKPPTGSRPGHSRINTRHYAGKKCSRGVDVQECIAYYESLYPSKLPIQKSHAPIDPKNAPASPGSTARPVEDPAGGTGLRPPRDPHTRPEPGRGAGIDSASDVGARPVVNAETGRFAQGENTITPASEIIALDDVAISVPRATSRGVTRSFEKYGMNVNAEKVLTDVPDSIQPLLKASTYDFMKKIEDIPGIGKFLIPRPYKIVDLFENMEILGALGAGFAKSVGKIITFFIIKTIFLGGFRAMQIEDTSSLVILGMHGPANGYSPMMRVCSDYHCRNKPHSLLWDPDEIALSTPCDPATVAVGYFCYDYWNGVRTAFIVPKDDSVRGCGDRGVDKKYGGCNGDEHIIQEYRFAVATTDVSMKPMQIDNCPSNADCSSRQYNIASYYCNPICWGYADANTDEVWCNFCFQTVLECSPPLALNVHVTSGCHLNLEGQYLCGDACAEDCDPKPRFYFCNQWGSDPYNQILTLEDYAYYLQLYTIVPPLLRTCVLVTLFNYGGKCCIQCPDGYFNQGCTGHRSVQSEKTGTLDTIVLWGSPGYCVKCSTENATVPFMTARCTDTQDTGFSCAKCDNPNYITKEACTKDHDTLCVPCPECPLDTFDALQKYPQQYPGHPVNCSNDVFNRVCLRCEAPYPLAEMAPYYTPLPDCQMTCNSGYILESIPDAVIAGHPTYYTCCAACRLLETWRDGTCTTRNTAVCRACTICGIGEEMYEECTLSSDRVCKPCLPRHYWIGGSSFACPQCPPSTYQNLAGQTYCKDCPANSYSTALMKKGYEDCVRLPFGASVIEWISPFTSSVEPVNVAWGAPNYVPYGQLYYCPDGTWFKGIVNTPIHVTLSCEHCMGLKTNVHSGVVLTSASSCKCIPGTFKGEEDCEFCEAGKYSNVLGATACQICGINTITTGQLPASFDGWLPWLNQREYLFHVSEGRIPPNTKCISCEAGKYTAQPGSSSCTVCEPGYFCNSTAKYICPVGYACPEGSQIPLLCEEPKACFKEGISAPISFVYCPFYSYNTGPYTCSPCPSMYGMAPAYYKQSDLSQGNCVSKNPLYPRQYCFLSISNTNQYVPCPGGCLCNNDSKIYNELPRDLPILGNNPRCGDVLRGVDVCVTCPPGKFQARVGALVCSSCWAGSYSSAPGAYPLCRDACPPGTFCPDGSINPTPCQVGSYAPEERMSVCTTCDVGKYSSETGQTSCVDCMAGMYTNSPGSVGCQGCLKGTVSPLSGASVCTQCVAGTYTTGYGYSGCLLCPYGKYGVSIVETCVSCMTGTYQNYMNATRCFPCEAGSFTIWSGSSVCALCLSGQYQSGTGSSSCNQCLPGKFSDQSGASTCTSCALSYYTTGHGALECERCTGWSFTENTGSTACKICAAGEAPYFEYGGYVAYVYAISGVFFATSCNPCWRGTYASTSGSSSCLRCDVGKYSSGYGASICTNCDVNYYSDLNMYLAEACKICPPGYIAPETGMSACTGCDSGKYKPTERMPECTPCTIGKYANEYGSSQCQSCEENTYSMGIGVTACIYCPSGTWTNSLLNLRCELCTPGTYREYLSPDVCMSCNPGTYQTGSGMSACDQCSTGLYTQAYGALNCTECPTGLFTSVTGSSECSQCDYGQFQTNTGQSSCVGCLPGFYNDKMGSTECLACMSGEFASAPGNRYCIPCSVGKFQSLQRASSCNDCNPGTYSQRTGVSVCQNCMIGTYMSSSGSSQCMFCPMGKFQDTVKATLCSACGPGRFSNVDGVSACQLCSIGAYTSLSVTTQCMACDFGKYGVTQGNSACLYCSNGTYTDKFGSTSCSLCIPGYYSGVPGQTYCSDCSVGTYQSGFGGTTCDNCLIGKYTLKLTSTFCECIQCEHGFYGVWNPDTWDVVCIPCPRGSYCVPCNGPVMCPVGTYHQLWTNTSIPSGLKNNYISPWVICPAGCICKNYAMVNFLPEFGVCGDLTGPAISASACVACGSGTYGSLVGQITCQACSAGKYNLVLGTTSSSSCQSCAVGKYKSVSGESGGCFNCQHCTAKGRYMAIPCGNSTAGSCVPCTIPVGTYVTVGTSNEFQDDCQYASCNTCSPGTYYSASCMWSGPPTCIPCSKWYFYSLDANSPSVFQMHVLPPGHYYLPVTPVNGPGSADGSSFIATYDWRPDICAHAPCTQCKIGEYLVSECVPASNSICGVCVKDVDHFFTSSGVATSDSCATAKCKSNCSVDNRVVSQCTPISDMICTPCPPVPPYMEYYYDMTQECVYRNCSPPSNYFLYGPRCWQTQECTSCLHGGQYYVSFCNLTHDAVCGNCTNKPLNSYYVSGVVSLSENECPYKEFCKSGEYVNNESCSLCAPVPPDPCFYNGIQVGHTVGSCNPTDLMDTYQCLCNKGYYQPSRFQCVACKTVSACGEFSALQGVCGPTNTADNTTCQCNNGYYQATPTSCAWCLRQEYCATALGGYYSGSCNPDDVKDNGYCTCPPGMQIYLKGCFFYCPAGQYQPSWTNSIESSEVLCLRCPSGTYSTGNGASVCQQCSIGTYHTLTGASSASSCVACDIGRYANYTNGYECIPCGIHMYGDTVNQLTCKKCPSGTFFEGLGATSVHDCVGCSAGTYMNDSETRNCIFCGIGKYQTGIGMYASYHDSCLLCPVGTYTEGIGTSSLSDCIQCSPGEYGVLDDTVGLPKCDLCGYGTYQTGFGQPSEASCQLCPPGKYNDRYGESSCILCEAATYQTGNGMQTMAKCEPCMLGKYQVTDRDVCTCGDDEYAPTHNESCVPCRIWSVSMCRGLAVSVTRCMSGATYDTTTCVCGSGWYNMPDRHCYACPPGTYQTGIGMSSSGVCVKCEIGKYQPVWNASSVDLCLPCPPGYYSNKSAEAERDQCTPCPPGTYQPGYGMIEESNVCQKCGTGKYQPVWHATRVEDCIPCPGGYYSNESIDSNRTHCIPCGKGYYQEGTGRTMKLYCVACSEGKYQPLLAGSGEISCLLCLPGSYSSMQGLSSFTECTLCGAGTYISYYGAKEYRNCLLCESGTYQSPNHTYGTSACLLCPPGKYGNSLAFSEATCGQCKVGTYQTGYGLPSFKLYRDPYYVPPPPTPCIPCRNGTYQSASGVSSPMGCTLCESGKYGTGVGFADSSACKLCGLGRYLSYPGASSSEECVPCPEGTYGTGVGMIMIQQCTQCHAGTYQTLVGMWNQSTCFSCLGGTFSVNDSAYGCSSCISGSFTSNVGSTNCTPCAPGRYADLDNSTFCDMCPPGTYQSSLAATECSQCSYGMYSSGSGVTVCSFCSPGQYTQWTQSTICTQCPIGKYQLSDGSMACTLCKRGTFASQVGTVTCTLCKRGTYQDTEGQSNCTDCNTGTYQTGSGSNWCTMCDSGTYLTSNGVYWSNTLGMAGGLEQGRFQGFDWTFGHGEDTVIFLQINRVSLAQSLLAKFIVYDCDTAECVSPTERISFIGGGSEYPELSVKIIRGFVRVSLIVRTKCVGNSSVCASYYYGICGAGMVKCFMDISWTVNASGYCDLCSPGTYLAYWTGQNCSGCAAGYYQSGIGSTVCSFCSEGTYSDGTSSRECTLCQFGKFNPNTGLTQCVQCESGKYVSQYGQAMCQDCMRGSRASQSGATACESCWPGTFTKDYMQVNCQFCFPGYYSDMEGATQCQQCLSGWYNEAYGASNCKICRPGSYQNANASTGCMLCQAGSYQTGWGMSVVCVLCPYHYQPVTGAYTFAQTCQDCPKGMYQTNNSCSLCPGGTYSMQIGMTYCTTCPLGLYSTGSGSDMLINCTLCPAGSFGVTEGATECGMCSPTTFSAKPNSSKCEPCLPGYYGYTTGQSACFPCSAGSYSSGFGSYYNECYFCQPGTYAHDSASTTCALCSPGTISDQNGSWVCSDCILGTYQSQAGQTKCALCWPGSFSSDFNATTCIKCDIGNHQREYGTYGCDACFIGTYQNQTGESQCIDCPPGSFVNETGSASCTLCLPGYYQNLYQASTCMQCPTGTYATGSGVSDSMCTMCDAGTYLEFTGSSSGLDCTLCPSGYASKRLALNTSLGCDMCPHGTVSLPNRSQCVTCVGSVYCPPGYETPIQCVQGLICNGSSIESPPGYLFVLTGNCTVLIPCPNGTHCYLRKDKAIFSGPMDNWFDLPVFVLKLGGSHVTDTSCNASFTYGVQRIDMWENVWTQKDVLFWLAPLVCASGWFLEGDVCTSCPLGYYSSESVAYANLTCQVCPAGTYQNKTGAYGAGTCILCWPGTFSNESGASVCQGCDPGFYQKLPGQLGCDVCSIGKFAGFVGQPECDECPRDTFQNETGMSACFTCEPGEFSSVGDVACTSCQSQGEPPEPWCATPRMPVNTSSLWLSVRGAHDECLGQGVSYWEDDETLQKQIYVNATTAACYHSLRVLGRPDLAKDWTVNVKDLRRPVTVEVVLFNTTFYQELCQSQGLSVLFVARDNRGETMIDIGDMTAKMQLRDFNSGGLLYQVSCSHIPVLSEDVIYGTCKTTLYCPTKKVQVMVVLTWPGGEIQGITVMTPAPTVLTPSPLGWVMSFQVQTPGIPYFAGDTVKIQVNSLNTYGTIAVFRFAATLGANVIFRRFTSVYTVVSGVQDGTLSVVGQTSADIGSVLGVIELTLLTATQGVNEIARVLGSFCEITLSDSVSYPMSSRLSIGGYVSDPLQPVIYLLMDVPRYTRLIARPRKTMLIQWQALTPSAIMYPTQIKVLGVENIMDRYNYVTASCVGLTGYLLVTSCENIKASGSGSGTAFAGVRVTFQGLSITVGFAVFVPQPMQTLLLPRSLGWTGHYKLLSTFYAGDVVIPDVDVTPYVDPMTLRVNINDQQWACRVDGTFTIGSASGVCKQTRTPGVGPVSSVLVWNEGLTGLGQYLLLPSRVTPSSPSGALMAFDDRWDILVPTSVTSGDPRRLRVSTLGVELVKLGESSRCVGLVVNGNGPFLVPVWSAAPKELQVEYTSSLLLSRLDATGLLPYEANVTQMWMVFDGYSTLVDLAEYHALGFTMSNNSLVVQGLTVATTEAYGKFWVGVSLLENTCVTGSYLFNVVLRAAGDPVLDCKPGLTTLTLSGDPMSLMFPSLYPSGFNLQTCFLRYTLADGSLKSVAASVLVEGTANVTVTPSGLLSPQSTGVIELRDSRANNVVTLQVVRRFAVSVDMTCNTMDCAAVKLTLPGDGASLPPFLYATQLSVGLTVLLWDGTRRNLTIHALGVSVRANGLSLLNPSVPLTYGQISLQATLTPAWELENLGRNVSVEGITQIDASAPGIIRQLHGSGMWEEIAIDVTGLLSDTTQKPVTAAFTGSEPLVQHANGRFHLDYFVANVSVLVSFGGREKLVLLEVTRDSMCITDVDILFLPGQWTGVANSRMDLVPTLVPAWNTPWTPGWNLSSRVVAWTSAQPSVLSIVSFPGIAPSIRLLDDYYEAIPVQAYLKGCDSDMTILTKTAYVIPNIAPNVDGQLDLGAETGLMLQATDVNDVVLLPVFVYASRALQTFTLEVTWPNQAMDVETCVPSDIRDSQCVLLKNDDSTTYVRSVGSYVSSILSGRVRLATLEVHVKLHALVEISLQLPQLVAYGKVWRNISKTYRVAVGGGAQARRRLLSTDPLQASRKLLALSGQPQVWGDADGDGECTSLDVQFLQLYLMYQAFSGDQQICVATCQWRSAMSAWQLSQLNPIRDPRGPAVPPDGSSVLFYLRALVRKTHFLSDWRVNITHGFFGMFVELTDYTGRRLPGGTSVKIALNTQLNAKLGFTGQSRVVDDWLQVGADTDVAAGGYSVVTVPNAAVINEIMVPVKILTETVDIKGQPALDRQFTFFVSKPFTFVSLLALNSTDDGTIVLPHIPIPNCTNLCDDVLYFDDFYVGVPSWAGSVLSVRYAIQAPSMRTQWFTVDLKVSQPIPVMHWLNTTGLNGVNRSTPNVSMMVEVNATFSVSFNVTDLPRGYALVKLVGLAPLGVSGADLYNGLFVAWPRQSATFQFQVQREGLSSIRFESESDPGIGQEYSMWGFVARPNVTQRLIWITPLCLEVILWSYLGGKDETCLANVTEEGVPAKQYTCYQYPCWITHDGQLYQVPVEVFIPYRPRVILQQNVIYEFGKTPWIATVSLWGETRNYMDVAVTQSAWSRGLIYAYPTGAISISPKWIQGLRVGMCAIYFGKIAASLNITLEPQAVTRLEALAFRGAAVTVQDDLLVEILWKPARFPAGSVGYVTVRVLFAGGFTIRLDIGSADGTRIDSLHPGINLHVDGSFEVHADVMYYDGILFVVHWNGRNTTVNGTLLPYSPSRVRVCCPQYVTYQSSPATGLGNYKSTFTLEEIVVSFTDHPQERVGLVDPRISVAYDPNVLSYKKGYWTVLDAPGIQLGPTAITVKYTHPVSLLQVTSETYVVIVDARDLLVSIEYDPGTIANQLWRLHCSNTFQTAYIQAYVDLEIDQVDVTGKLQILSSNPKAIQVSGSELRGVAPGVSEILVFYRGFTKSMQIEVVGDSLPLVELQWLYPHVVFQGPLRSSKLLELGGYFQGQDHTELFWVPNVTFVNPLIETSPELMLLDGYMLQLVANTFDPLETRGGFVMARVAGCGGVFPDDLVVDVSVNLNMTNTNETGLDIGSQLGGPMIPHGSVEAPLWLHVGSGTVLSYYIELRTDLAITGCARGRDTAGFFECTTHDPVGMVRLAGTGLPRTAGLHKVASLLVSPTLGNESICGHLEVFGDAGVQVVNLSVGLLGRGCGPGEDDVNPLVDSSVIQRDYQCVLGLTSPCQSTLVDSWYHMLLLVHKQRHVTPVVYSNDLELSVMLQVLDRFERPDDSRALVNVTLFTDQIPVARGLIGSTLVLPGAMTVQNIVHYKDGWYLVQWRQKIPTLNLTVLFELATVDDTGQTAWDRGWILQPLVVNVTTGRALPNCPHSVYDPGFLQSSYVLYVANASNLTFGELWGMRKYLGCSIDSTARRIEITALDDTRISVTVNMESFMRLHEMNSYLLDLDFMKTVLLPYNRTLLKVERGLSRYLLSAPDPPLVCPTGYFINGTADLEPLPQHADSGADCYGFVCWKDYERYGPDCIPRTTDDRLFWSSILLVLTLILAIIVTSCLMRVSTWGLESKPDVTGPKIMEAEPEQAPAAPPNVLPVDVVDIDGIPSLVFEEDGDSSSCSSDMSLSE